MKQPLSHPMRIICVLFAVCALTLCGLTTFAAEASSSDLQQTTPEPIQTINSPPQSEPEVKYEIYPTDVQTITEENGRQIVKTYVLTAGENPTDISRDSFTLDGWLYEISDTTKSKTSEMDTRHYAETLEIDTESNDLSKISAQLSPTLEYKSEDGYCGLLTLDLASVKCEASTFKNSSYTVTATREYANLPANDLYYIPKTITDNGRILSLDGVEWEAQSVVNVGYTDIPESYRAVAKYKGKASQSVATGYVTKAEYYGDISKEIEGDMVYKVYFAGAEINPAPQEPEPAQDNNNDSIPIVPIISVAVIVIACAGAAVFFFLRHNVKVYSIGEDGYRILVAKVKVSVKNPVIDLTPLDSSEIRYFGLEIDKPTAKSLSGITVEVLFGPVKLQHKIAYEGNVYRIEANFHDASIKAIY